MYFCLYNYGQTLFKVSSLPRSRKIVAVEKYDWFVGAVLYMFYTKNFVSNVLLVTVTVNLLFISRV